MDRGGGARSRQPEPGALGAARSADGKEKTIYAGTAILQKPTWMPDSKHLVLIFHDVSSDWNGQVGEIAIAAGKLHRITNDLNSYSNLTLGRDQRRQATDRDADHARSRQFTR